MSDIGKKLSVKFIGTNREHEFLTIMPGALVRDVLNDLNVSTGHSITNPANPDQQFNLTDNLYAAVEDGDMLAIVADIDAGIGGAV